MNENLIALYQYTLPIHIALFHTITTFILIYIALTQIGIKTKNYVLRIRYYLPLYHGVLATMFFSGLLLWSTYDFEINLKIIKMFIGILGLIISSAIGFKKLKIYAKESKLKDFKKIALYKSSFDIVLILIAGL